MPTSRTIPDRPAGDVYCRVPQDSPFNVRGARNMPCETVPGKRAADGEDVREQRELRAAQRRLQLEGRPERDAVRPGRSAVAAGVATGASSSAAGSGPAADSGRRVRPGHRHVRWTGRACVHTVQPGP